MSRILTAVAAAAVLLLGLFVPATLAADPAGSSRSVVMAVGHDTVVPKGDHVDTLLVIRANARVEGSVDTIVVIDGTATLVGATVDSMAIINGTAYLQDGATVTGDVGTVDATVSVAPGAVVKGSTRAYEGTLAAFAVALIPLFILLFVGFGIAAIAAALLVAAFASRQVRQAEGLISNEPGSVLVAGIAGSILLPTLAFLVTLTVIGAPIGLGALLVVLPALAFLGWIVAAIWVGDWILGRTRGASDPGQPYVAAVVGVFVLAFAGILPFVGTVASLFGFGALMLMAWRILRPPTPAIPAGSSSLQPAPAAG